MEWGENFFQFKADFMEYASRPEVSRDWVAKVERLCVPGDGSRSLGRRHGKEYAGSATGGHQEGLGNIYSQSHVGEKLLNEEYVSLGLVRGKQTCKVVHKCCGRDSEVFQE